jgi:hypothetical protein
MADPNVLLSADRARAQLSGSIREFLERFSSAQLTSIVALALLVASGIALYAPRWWLAGLLAFAIGAAALAGAADRRIGALGARSAPNQLPMVGPLRALRGFAAALATLAVVAFVLIGVAFVLGNPGAGG